jgi:hypothetical protein
MEYEIVEYKYMGMTIKNIKAINDAGEVLWIPLDPANSDYQAYLAWVAEGNEATVVEQDN